MRDDQSTDVLAAVSSALVALHKEQFGRGPASARAEFAGPDALLCVLHDVLLPAERALVQMGEQQRVREQRLFMQVATRERFVPKIEEITGRRIRSFTSASDPDQNMALEVVVFEPR